MQIDQLIGELLVRNNCVVVPKFGGFVATQSHAQIDFSKGLMTPPQKAVLFNKQLVNNDGLLVHALAQKEQTEYDQALEKIDGQVKIWQEELHAGKRVTFDKVGFLYLDNEKNMRFEQDRFFNLLLQSFGMGSVQFVAEQEEIREEPVIVFETSKNSIVLESIQVKETPIVPLPVAASVSTEKKIVPIQHNISRKKVLKYVAAACLIPIGFYTYWIPMKTDFLESGIIRLEDFNPFNTKQTPEKPSKTYVVVPAKKQAEPQVEEPYHVTQEDDFAEPRQIQAEKQADKLPEVEVEQKTVHTVSESNGRFHIIVGSFSNEINAQSLADELKAKGFNTIVFPEESGLIRVSAGKAASDAAAQELVKVLNDIQVSSWILKK